MEMQLPRGCCHGHFLSVVGAEEKHGQPDEGGREKEIKLRGRKKDEVSSRRNEIFNLGKELSVRSLK